MVGRKILHQRTASETNASSRSSSLVSQKGKKGRTFVSGSKASKKGSEGGNEKSDSSSVHTETSVASFGSLPPVPPLRIKKLLPPIQPLSVHRSARSQDLEKSAHDLEYSQGSNSRPGSYQQPIYRDSQEREPTTNLPQLLSPFSPQAPGIPASPSPSQASNSSSRPLLPVPLKPILKKPKQPLGPASVEDYKERRSSWVTSTFSNASHRELQHMRSLRLVNEEMEDARIGSDISSPTSAHYSRYSSVSGTASRPLSSRLSAGLQEWGTGRNSAANSAANTRSTRSSSFGLSSTASTPTPGPSFYPAWARKYYGSGEKAFAEINEEDEAPRQPRLGRRALSEDDSELAIREVTVDPRRFTYPYYRPDTQHSEGTQWSYPHLERPPPAKTEYFRPQLFFFILGFILPVSWWVGACWPLSPKPSFVPEAPVTVGRPNMKDLELAVFNSPDDERKYENARWWRNVNRIMSVVGLLLVGGIVALAILSTK